VLLAGKLLAAEQDTTSQAIQIKALQGTSNDLLQGSRFKKSPTRWVLVVLDEHC